MSEIKGSYPNTNPEQVACGFDRVYQTKVGMSAKEKDKQYRDIYGNVKFDLGGQVSGTATSVEIASFKENKGVYICDDETANKGYYYIWNEETKAYKKILPYQSYGLNPNDKILVEKRNITTRELTKEELNLISNLENLYVFFGNTQIRENSTRNFIVKGGTNQTPTNETFIEALGGYPEGFNSKQRWVVNIEIPNTDLDGFYINIMLEGSVGNQVFRKIVKGFDLGIPDATDWVEFAAGGSGGSTYVLPNATKSTLGGVIVGDGLNVVDGVINANNKIDKTQIGVANGVASLGSDGRVPSSQLPAGIDEIQEYPSLSAFPTTGDAKIIYVALDTNKTYRWSGSKYSVIGSDLALGETAETAYAGSKGKANADAIANLKTNKQDKLSEEQITNINSVPNKVNNSTFEENIQILNRDKQDTLSAQQISNINSVPSKQDKLSDKQIQDINSIPNKQEKFKTMEFEFVDSFSNELLASKISESITTEYDNYEKGSFIVEVKASNTLDTRNSWSKNFLGTLSIQDIATGVIGVTIKSYHFNITEETETLIVSGTNDPQEGMWKHSFEVIPFKPEIVIPQATVSTLGGIIADQKKEEDTQEVRIDESTGKLYTKAGGGGGEGEFLAPNEYSVFISNINRYNNTFTLNGTNLEVDWGDGKKETINGTKVTHTYDRNVSKDRNVCFIKHKGAFSKITEIKPLNNEIFMHLGNAKLNKLAIGQFQNVLTNIDYINNDTIANCSSAFEGCTALQQITNLRINANNIYKMFFNCKNLISIPNFSSSPIGSCSSAFEGCTALKEAPELDLSSCTSFDRLFANCTSIEIIPYYDAIKCQNFLETFLECSNVKVIHMMNYNANFNISACTKMNRSALLEVIDNLVKQTSGNKTLTIGATNKAKLTEADIQIATEKGWTIA